MIVKPKCRFTSEQFNSIQYAAKILNIPLEEYLSSAVLLFTKNIFDEIKQKTKEMKNEQQTNAEII